MLRRSIAARMEYRAYYNLASGNNEGRRMTGHMTAYRHWMWKQNELWRNVHEAQFEHLRNVYRRQWFEAFRVNADEYIYKYNITKAAQLASWEREMHAQEAKRVDALHTAQGRQQLRRKHLDLLREHHERHFFYWYERASERLQAMTRIRYVPQAELAAHVERELNKYTAERGGPYPLNFVGQMPMIEDGDGNVVQVPEGLLARHVAERGDADATAFAPPSRDADADERLRARISAMEEDLDPDAAAGRAAPPRAGGGGPGGDSSSGSVVDGAEDDDAMRVALSEEQTEAEREISRRAYIDRGRVGAKQVFRRAPTVIAPAVAGGMVMPAPGAAAAATATPAAAAGEDGAPPADKKGRAVLTQRQKKKERKAAEQAARVSEAQQRTMNRRALVEGAKGRTVDRLNLDALREAFESSDMLQRGAESTAQRPMQDHQVTEQNTKRRREEEKAAKAKAQQQPSRGGKGGKVRDL